MKQTENIMAELISTSNNATKEELEYALELTLKRQKEVELDENLNKLIGKGLEFTITLLKAFIMSKETDYKMTA